LRQVGWIGRVALLEREESHFARFSLRFWNDSSKIDESAGQGSGMLLLSVEKNAGGARQQADAILSIFSTLSYAHTPDTRRSSTLRIYQEEKTCTTL
jgi:hypothetical protein